MWKLKSNTNVNLIIRIQLPENSDSNSYFQASNKLKLANKDTILNENKYKSDSFSNLFNF